jgi:hypothetical protein
MTEDKKLDDGERADLLCFLVMAQLIGHASTGKWLRTDHVVEAARIWVASNSTECDWLVRAKLARMAADIAPTFLVFPCFSRLRKYLTRKSPKRSVQTLLVKTPQL